MSSIDMFPETHVDPSIDSDRRYTTRETVDLCRKLAQVQEWDLDVAADEESHWAPKWFDLATNGLEQPWAAERVWCNPPWSDIAPWAAKAWNEIVAPHGPHTIAMLVPATRTEQAWWHEHIEARRDGRQVRESNGRVAFLRTYYLPGRQRFGHPGNRDAIGVPQPNMNIGNCVLLVWRTA